MVHGQLPRHGLDQEALTDGDQCEATAQNLQLLNGGQQVISAETLRNKMTGKGHQIQIAGLSTTLSS